MAGQSLENLRAKHENILGLADRKVDLAAEAKLRKLAKLRAALGLGYAREALKDPVVRAEYDQTCELHYQFRVPLVLDAIEREAIKGNARSQELFLRLFYKPYQRLLGTSTSDPAKSEIGELLRKILRQAPAEAKVRLVREVMEVSSGNAPDAREARIVDAEQVEQPQAVEGQSVKAGNVQ